jgi:hypothetical protein
VDGRRGNENTRRLRNAHMGTVSAGDVGAFGL